MAPLKITSQQNIEEDNPSMESTNPDSPSFISQRSELTGNDYPGPSSFDYLGRMNELLLYADEPWVQLHAMEDTELLRRYSNSDGWLAGNVPLAVTEKALWRDHCFYYDPWF